MDQDSKRLIETLLGESDRGIVLAGAAFLDEALEDLLTAAFRDNLSNHHKKSLFTHFGPLSSMSSRTLIAYAFNLIDEKMRDCLDQVRSIRNHFAHFAGPTALPLDEIDRLLSTSDPSLNLAVAAFGDPKNPKFSDARVKITLCIVSLWAKIRNKAKEIKN